MTFREYATRQGGFCGVESEDEVLGLRVEKRPGRDTCCVQPAEKKMGHHEQRMMETNKQVGWVGGRTVGYGGNESIFTRVESLAFTVMPTRSRDHRHRRQRRKRLMESDASASASWLRNC